LSAIWAKSTFELFANAPVRSVVPPTSPSSSWIVALPTAK
jgi:hypothetical protein